MKGTTLNHVIEHTISTFKNDFNFFVFPPISVAIKRSIV